MRDFLHTLPDQSLAARRRFVVLATALSFVLIVLVWAGIVATANRRSAELRAQAAQPIPVAPGPPAAAAVPPPPPPPPAGPAQEEEEPTVPLPNPRDIADTIADVFGPGR